MIGIIREWRDENNTTSCYIVNNSQKIEEAAPNKVD
jgi:hypothetical protein